MKRGERKKWRELALICTQAADSQDYAQEYVAKRDFTLKLDELSKLIHGETARIQIRKR